MDVLVYGTVFSGYFFKQLRYKKINKILLIATGALTNATTSQQGESIPGIAHAIAIENWHILDVSFCINFIILPKGTIPTLFHWKKIFKWILYKILIGCSYYVVKSVQEYGLLGAFIGGVKASNGGITAAVFFGYLASLIAKPKMKKQ